MSIDQSTTLCPSVDFWLQLGILCFNPTDICRFNLPFVPGIAGVSIFFGSGKRFTGWWRWSKMGEPVQSFGVLRKSNISHWFFVPLFFSPRTDEGCLVYYACCKEEHSPLSICTDSGLQWGQAVLVGVLLSWKYRTKCCFCYKSRESEPSIPMSLAAREVITPGQDIKRIGILVISNKFGSFQLLAPECLVLLVLWHIVCIKNLSYYLFGRAAPYKAIASCILLPFQCKLPGSLPVLPAWIPWHRRWYFWAT